MSHKKQGDLCCSDCAGTMGRWIIDVGGDIGNVATCFSGMPPPLDCCIEMIHSNDLYQDAVGISLDRRSLSGLCGGVGYGQGVSVSMPMTSCVHSCVK